MSHSPTLYVDADACPKVIKEILYRAADRAQLPLLLVANQGLTVPPSPYIKTLRVSAGFDVADNEIVQRCQAGDLVVTADIPLAAEVVAKGAVALNPRGELYTEHNIRARLNIRDFMDTLRSSGVQTGGPPPLSQTERQAFANALDRYLAKAVRASRP
ncbi:YaiI/YqxD family protein [Ferrimonas gelatinilytica]